MANCCYPNVYPSCPPMCYPPPQGCCPPWPQPSCGTPACVDKKDLMKILYGCNKPCSDPCGKPCRRKKPCKKPCSTHVPCRRRPYSLYNYEKCECTGCFFPRRCGWCDPSCCCNANVQVHQDAIVIDKHFNVGKHSLAIVIDSI